jgi:hypothetical protein
MVELGIASAAVALVAVIGLNILSGAEKAALQTNALAMPTPTVTGARYLNPTTTTVPWPTGTGGPPTVVGCFPSPPYPSSPPPPPAPQPPYPTYSVSAGDALSCAAIVQDINTGSQSPPPGTVQWYLNGVLFATCPLGFMTSNSTTCGFAPYRWTTPGLFNLVAVYVPNDTVHGASRSWNPPTNPLSFQVGS